MGSHAGPWERDHVNETGPCSLEAPTSGWSNCPSSLSKQQRERCAPKKREQRVPLKGCGCEREGQEGVREMAPFIRDFMLTKLIRNLWPTVSVMTAAGTTFPELQACTLGQAGLAIFCPTATLAS